MILGSVLVVVGAVLAVNGLWVMGSVGTASAAVVNLAAGIAGVIGGVVLAVRFRDKDTWILSAVTVFGAAAYVWSGLGNLAGGTGPALGWFYLAIAPLYVFMAARCFRSAREYPILWWLGSNWAGWALLNVLAWLVIALRLWSLLALNAIALFAAAIVTGLMPGVLIMSGRLTFAAAAIAAPSA